ncbi:MAG: tetratricopeptide repeat protein [Acidobacteria bacterium]|nr:tetratricopeptide repeat protein [Acidobacteriota bacterium]
MDNIKVRNHLEEVLRSDAFAKAGRQARLLRYIVEKSLTGSIDDLKEYTIALEVFDRTADYDPKQESTVRVEASKLRARLERYYEAAGPAAIRIEIPKGGYVARFVEQQPGAAPAVSRRRLLLGGAAMGGMAAAAAVVLRHRVEAPTPPVILVAGETASRGGFTDDAAQLLHRLANELGFLRIPVIQAKDLDQLKTQSQGAAYCVTAMAGRCWEDASRLRLMAELREVSYDFRVWSSSWDAAQGGSEQQARDAAASIARQLQGIQRAGQPSETRKNALAAYRRALGAVRPYKDFTLQTTEEKQGRTRIEVLMEGARLLEEAARIDPTFVEPLAQLAWVYRLTMEYDRGMLARASQTANRALRLDPASVAGNFVCGYLGLLEEWDIGAAEAAMRKCIERSAFHVEAYRFYADAAAIRGRAKEALTVIAKPLSVMPRSKILRFAATTTLLHAGRGQEAEELARESLRWEPDWPVARWMLGRALEAQGRTREAEGEFRSIFQLDPKSQRFAAALAHLWAESGGPRQYGRSMEILRSAGMEKTAPSLVGLVEARCGDRGKALDWMERAEREHDHNLPYSVVDPHFAGLRSLERGERIYRRFAG